MLSRDVVKAAQRVNIRAKRLVDGAFSGEFHSLFRGRGLECAEVRPYMPGDDVRTIDWNVTARSAEPYVKQYVEERELTVMLLVDVSGSAAFGSAGRRKLDAAIEIAGLFALSTVRNNDNVGLIAFSDRIERRLAPRKGRNRAMRIIVELMRMEPTGRGTDLTGALQYLLNVVRRRAVVVIVSDFLAPDYARALRMVHRRHEVIAVAVRDPLETQLPDVGLIALRDMETGNAQIVDTGDARMRAAYQAAMQATTTERQDLFRKLELDWLDVQLGEDYLHAVSDFVLRRSHRGGSQRHSDQYRGRTGAQAAA